MGIYTSVDSMLKAPSPIDGRGLFIMTDNPLPYPSPAKQERGATYVETYAYEGEEANYISRLCLCITLII